MTRFEMTLKESQLNRAKISYWIRQNQPGDNSFFGIDSNNYKETLESDLPDVAEQADLLLLSLGDELKDRGPGSAVARLKDDRPATIGALNPESVDFLFNELRSEGLLGLEDSATPAGRHRLTFQGWRKYDELKRGRIESKRAFMAMAYAPEHVRYAYENCFKVACKRTGYQLSIVPEISDTGSINNHIVVGIVNSKFVIVDLTDNNNGAYWEAGFAEGLGRPVFYTCEKGFFENTRTHFDTNHHVTTLWESGKLPQAEQDLVDRIRRKFPDDAVRED